MTRRMTGFLALVSGGAVSALLMTAPTLAQDDDLYHPVGATLFGENEIGHEGAADDAGGDFDGEIDLSTGTLCYYLEIYGLEDVTTSHLYKGGKGVNGEPVLTLKVMGEDGDEECAEADPELLRDIKRNEFNYYVNVHSQTYPAGAIRGQLGS